jgi:6-phosphogluconolactonase (cycloisomerase 2 family)
MRYPLRIVQTASHLWILAQGRKTIKAALLLCFAGLIAGCGFSSNSISIVGPTPPALTSISVAPANLTLHVGSTRQFIATGGYSDGSQQDITASVTWSSTAATVASINNVAGSNGVATAVGAGSTTITATSGTLSGSTTLAVTSVTLVSIGVTPAASTIAKGTTQQFTATGVYSDNTTQNLTPVVSWHVVNPAVASITTALGSGGLATGVAPGTTQVTASLGGVIGSTNLTVTAAVLVSIAVTPANASIAKGTTQQFTATGTYSNNSTQDLTATATWAPTASAIATVSNTAGSIGKATALGTGSVTITASLGGVTGTTMLTVTPAALVSIAVTPANSSIAKGTTQQLTATGTYTDSSTLNLTTSVTWAPIAGAIATISNAAGSQGLADALSPGSVTVTATLGTVVGTTQLTVTAATLVSIDVTPTTATIRIGATHAQQYTATGHYTDLTTQDLTTSVTWNSATIATATISNAAGSNGKATGLAQGTTLITAALGTINSNANPATLTVAAFAYAVNIDKSPNVPNANTLSQYIIGTNGTLIPMTTPMVATGTNPYSLTTDPSNQFVYVANYDTTNATTGSVSQFAIGADGSLTPLSTPSVATGGGPNGIAANPTAPYVYVANYNSSNVSQYQIGVGGLLTALSTPTVGTGPGASGAASIALTPAGTYAYVANNNYSGTVGSVSQYNVGAFGSAAPGSLTLMTNPTVPAGAWPNDVVVDPSGRFVYVVNSRNNANGDSISQYTIQSDGSLMAMSPPTVTTLPNGREPWSITIDAAGHNAYVPNRTNAPMTGTGIVSHYTIDATGALTFANSVPAGVGPTSLAIDPSGGFAYVTNRDSGLPSTVSQFSIAANGDLTPLAPPTATAGVQPATIITSR